MQPDKVPDARRWGALAFAKLESGEPADSTETDAIRSRRGDSLTNSFDLGQLPQKATVYRLKLVRLTDPFVAK